MDIPFNNSNNTFSSYNDYISMIRFRDSARTLDVYKGSLPLGTSAT